MNFKYFIPVLYLSFVALILTMVFKSCNQNIELESKNYYADELQYQTRIDAKLLGNQYADSFAVTEENGIIKIAQPLSVISDSIKIEFRKPDNANADKKYVFTGSKIEDINSNDLARGVYGLSIRLFTKNGELLIEKKIQL